MQLPKLQSSLMGNKAADMHTPSKWRINSTYKHPSTERIQQRHRQWAILLWSSQTPGTVRSALSWKWARHTSFLAHIVGRPMVPYSGNWGTVSLKHSYPNGNQNTIENSLRLSVVATVTVWEILTLFKNVKRILNWFPQNNGSIISTIIILRYY
jgi:hypothetical protein